MTAKTFKFDPQVEAQKLADKISKWACSQERFAGEPMVYQDDKGVWAITIESPVQLAMDMETFIRDSKHGYLVRSEETTGCYDWVSDYYCKDSSTVYFILKP